jgi:hypothetical protein
MSVGRLFWLAAHGTQRKPKGRLTMYSRKSKAEVMGGAMVAIALLLSGCGYFCAGMWEDDAGNWERAWGYPKPPEVEMPHSWYYRSPHFTREEIYFFEFRPNQPLFDAFVKANNMTPLGAGDPRPEEIQFSFPRPDWFTPKPPAAYDMWVMRGSATCYLFCDKESRELFIYACQL